MAFIKLNKKGYGGGPLALIVGLVLVFFVGIVYVIMSKPWGIIYDFFSANLSAEYLPTAHKIQSVWMNWPILVILGIILFVVVAIARNSSNTGEAMQ